VLKGSTATTLKVGSKLPEPGYKPPLPGTPTGIRSVGDGDTTTTSKTSSGSKSKISNKSNDTKAEQLRQQQRLRELETLLFRDVDQQRKLGKVKTTEEEGLSWLEVARLEELYPPAQKLTRLYDAMPDLVQSVLSVSQTLRDGVNLFFARDLWDDDLEPEIAERLEAYLKQLRDQIPFAGKDFGSLSPELRGMFLQDYYEQIRILQQPAQNPFGISDLSYQQALTQIEFLRERGYDSNADQMEQLLIAAQHPEVFLPLYTEIFGMDFVYTDASGREYTMTSGDILGESVPNFPNWHPEVAAQFVLGSTQMAIWMQQPWEAQASNPYTVLVTLLGIIVFDL
jgi:hypothetical protein